jgi:hypothetical protein
MPKTLNIQFKSTYENGKVTLPTKCLVCGKVMTKTTYAAIHIGKQTFYAHGNCYDIKLVLEKLKK